MDKSILKTIGLFGEHHIVFKESKKARKNTLFEYDNFIDKFEDKKTTDK
jgi:hypothetical protein